MLTVPSIASNGGKEAAKAAKSSTNVGEEFTFGSVWNSPNDVENDVADGWCSKIELPCKEGWMSIVNCRIDLGSVRREPLVKLAAKLRNFRSRREEGRPSR